ncbi:hypothetical protein BGZ47_006558 [Haplosporangium gracile]|nr:hypothetical protein BGZ47_006558 [Haplosporangium gracile]
MAYTEHHQQQHEETLNPGDFRKRDHEAVHGVSLLAPSRSTTPVPPTIPKRPDSRSALYDSGHETMVVDEVEDVLLNVNSNLSVLGLQKQRQQQGSISGEEDELSQQQRRRPLLYHPGGSTTTANSGNNGLGQKQGLGLGHDRYSSYDYGVPINYRTGASEYYDDLDSSDSSKGAKVEVHVDSSATHTTHTEPTRPVSSQRPSQTRLSRQEQMLKRSSQVIPVHHKYNHKNNSSTTLVEPQQAATTPPPQKEMTKEEREKLEKVFKKKRSLSEKYGPGGAPPPVRLESVAHHGNNSQGYLYGDDGTSDGGSILKKEKGRWIDRPCGCLPAGLVTFFAFKLSLLYNGALGAILFQASQFNEVGMSPIFGFAIAFFVATGISALGLITVGILASRNYYTGKSIPSRLPLRVFKLIHALYLLCSVLATTACMLSWLALNNSQTGTWTRLQLSPTPATTSEPSFISHAPVFSIESILKPDPDHPGWLVVNPWLWIVAFVALGLVQLYFWFCMVAYARSHLAQWRSGFQTRMRRLEAMRALEDGVGREDLSKSR